MLLNFDLIKKKKKKKEENKDNFIDVQNRLET